MPFDPTMYARQARRAAARKTTPELDMNPDKRTRRERRILAGLRPPRTAIPLTDIGWVAGLLEGKAWVGVDRRTLRATATIEAQPRVLTLLRRRIGGYVKDGRWRMEGRKAEAILLAVRDRLVGQETQATFALALQNYRRRNKGMTAREAAPFFDQIKGG